MAMSFLPAVLIAPATSSRITGATSPIQLPFAIEPRTIVVNEFQRASVIETGYMEDKKLRESL